MTKPPLPLRRLDQWCYWIAPEKRPRRLGGGPASKSDLSTWAPYHQVAAHLDSLRRQDTGYGFMFNASDPYMALDFDGAVIDGVIHPEAKAVLDLLGCSWSEHSMSHRGLHCVIELDRPPRWPNKRVRRMGWGDKLEAIWAGWLAMTGEHVTGTSQHVRKVDAGRLGLLYPPEPETDGHGALPTVCVLSDEQVVSAVRELAPDEWEGQVRGDHSNADWALCNALAQVIGNDPDRIESIFRQSALMRPKFDARRMADDGEVTTYGRRTIARAIARNK